MSLQLKHPPTEEEIFIEVLRHDAFHDIELRTRVLVDGNVSEPHHALERVSERLIQKSVGLQQVERLAAILWNSEMSATNHVHSQVNGYFTGPL